MIELLSAISLNIISTIIYEKLDMLNYDKKVDKKLRRIITLSVSSTVMKFTNSLTMRERVSKDLIDLIVDDHNLSKLEIEKIFEDALNDFQYINHDSKQLTDIFLTKLLTKAFSDLELRTVLSEISSINTGLKVDTIVDQNKSLLTTNNVILVMVTEILELLKSPNNKIELLDSKANAIKNEVDSLVRHQSNNRSIPHEFVNYYEKPLFLESDNNIKLRDVYIVPKYIITDFPVRNSNLIRKDIVSFINDFVESKLIDKKYYTCLSQESRRINLLFVKGMPGNGKSSLFYHLSFKKLYDTTFLSNYRLYFIKFIDLFKEYGKIDCENPLADILNYAGQSSEELKNTVFILDGLDEICTVKGIDIELLCENLIESLSRYTNVKAIITTRLNYVNINQTNNRNVINIKLLGLNDEDKLEWIAKYFNLKSNNEFLKTKAISNVVYLSHLDDNNLVELLSIPLIFYMISATGIEINELNNIGELYDQVFFELFNRSYNDSITNTRQKHGVYKEISVENARRIAQVIAYEMYTTNRTLLPISNRKIQSVFNEITEDELKSKHKRRIEKLFLLTFFFKENEDIVEFAHKSIMEFFTAEYLINELLDSDSSIIKSIYDLIVKQPVSLEVLTFIKYKFRSDTCSKTKLDYDEFIEHFVSEIADFISKDITEQFSFLSIEKADDYLAFLRVVLYFGEDIFMCNTSNILLNDKSVVSMLKASLVDNIFNRNKLLQNNVIPFKLNGHEFLNEDFNGLSFVNSLFSNVFFINSSFSRAAFSNYEMTNCSFKHCLFQNTTFNNLRLINCKFEKTILELNIKNKLYFEACDFLDIEKFIIISKEENNDDVLMYKCTIDIYFVKRIIEYFVLKEPRIIIKQAPQLDSYILTLESYKFEKLRQEREFGQKNYRIDFKQQYEVNINEIGAYYLSSLNNNRIENPMFIFREE